MIAGAALSAAAYSIASVPAMAGDQPLYEPALPAWVVPAPPVDVAALAKGSPILIFDMQSRLEGARVWNYVDTAYRIDTPQALTQLGTLTAAWSPGTDDLIVHRVQILRGTTVIDVLAGTKFTILRREQELERRVVDGQLTATLAVPGLQVGDVLRLTVSVSTIDKALGGRAQGMLPALTMPASAGFSRLRASWPTDGNVAWKFGPNADGTAPKVTVQGKYTTVEVAVPLPKRGELPDDAPLRYRMPSLLQFATFKSWEDVSRTMAPLFATQGLIAPGDPIDLEVQAIKKATSDPLDRAARALTVVQDKISYLLVALNGGNYVPQPPARTWELRYGDCKAKTLLLLSMLRAMDIEAEPVLARSTVGDALPSLLPQPADFDHVLVRARIGGEDLFLDGTSLGAKLADLRDAPNFSYVLPLRTEGAPLMPVPVRFRARADIDVDLTFDERASVDLPTLFDVAVTMRGATAAQIKTTWAQTSDQQRRDFAKNFLASYVTEPLLGEWGLRVDEVTGTVTIWGKGLIGSQWQFDKGRMRQNVELLFNPFAPDRARPSWQSIPVAGGSAPSRRWRTRFLLPQGGEGITVDGNANVESAFGTGKLSRKLTISGATALLDERSDSANAEVAPADIAAQKAKAAAVSKSVQFIASDKVLRRWQADPAALTTSIKPIEAMLTKAIAAWPEDTAGYSIRADLYGGIYDWKRAATDLGQAIRISPTVDLYVQRAAFRTNIADRAGALADLDAALALDPGNASVAIAKADVLANLGRAGEAEALLRTKLDDPGLTRESMPDVVSELAQVLAADGKGEEALALVGSRIAVRPGDPRLLNSSCWVKGLSKLQLESALKDCTKAIELSDDPAEILDSRALVYFRLGRFSEAMGDVDAALQANPAQTPTIFLRGIVRKQMGATAEGQADIDLARKISPTVASLYAKFGITP